MILLVWGALLLAVTAAAYVVAHTVVTLLDPLIGYRPEREDGRTPFPDDSRRKRTPVPLQVQPHGSDHGRHQEGGTWA